MIETYSELLKYVKKYNVISDKHRKIVIDQDSNLKWRKHTWSDYDKKIEGESSNTEFDRAPVNSIAHLVLNSYIDACINNYVNSFNSTPHSFLFNGYTAPNINKYEEGTKMRSHVDHIYTCFDGTVKGIPILSVVGLLNDDFNGGEFLFWDNTVYELKAGDIMIFPSNFMYPHSVNTVTSGSRISFVSWVY